MCNFLRITLISCFLFISGYIKSDCYGSELEGSACQQLGNPGICKTYTNCPEAVESLNKKGYHNLKRCGFKGTEEIVCCPDYFERIKEVGTTTTEAYIWTGNEDTPKGVIKDGVEKKRKCEIMCKKTYDEINVKPSIVPQVLNGKTAKKGQFPHAVALGYENSDDGISWNCGATLIAPRFLLTAAHCFICYACTDPKKARLGIIDITNSQEAQNIDIKNTIPHPKYDPISKQNDIGIIELLKDVEMSKLIYPACLYTKADDPLGLQIIGWGQTVSNDDKSRARILQYAFITPIPLNECNSSVVSATPFVSTVILETQICGTTNKSDACPGDSGGPLQMQRPEGGYSIVGVVSYGGSECGSEIPGVYTRVEKYLDWIEKIVWPDS